MNALVALQYKCQEVTANWNDCEWDVSACVDGVWYFAAAPSLVKAARAVLGQMEREDVSRTNAAQ